MTFIVKASEDRTRNYRNYLNLPLCIALLLAVLACTPLTYTQVYTKRGKKMTSVYHAAGTRGYANHGWLKSNHSFSFASYYNPERMGFGLLRVLNDDIIAGGSGFGTHGHDNMEIISIPIYGALAHKDSEGNSAVIRSGEVQIMSAGSGIRHSEYNASETDSANFLQIWVMPKERNITPRYGQKVFDVAERHNKWQTVVSPDTTTGALWINQDAKVSLADFDAGLVTEYSIMRPENGAYLFVISGTVKIGDTKLTERDAIGISNTKSFSIEVSQKAELLVLDIPMSGR